MPVPGSGRSATRDGRARAASLADRGRVDRRAQRAQVADRAHGVDPVPVEDRDPGAVIAAVFELLEPRQQQRRVRLGGRRSRRCRTFANLLERVASSPVAHTGCVRDRSADGRLSLTRPRREPNDCAEIRRASQSGGPRLRAAAALALFVTCGGGRRTPSTRRQRSRSGCRARGWRPAGEGPRRGSAPASVSALRCEPSPSSTCAPLESSQRARVRARRGPVHGRRHRDTFQFRTPSPRAIVEPGAKGALGWIGSSRPLPPARLAGLVQSTSSPFGGADAERLHPGRPNRLSLGHRLVERGERDHAPELRRAATRRDVLEVAPDAGVALHQHVATHQDRRQQALANRGLAVDLSWRSRPRARPHPANGRSARTPGHGCSA